MILRGAGSVAAVSSICGVDISSLPNLLLSAMRLSMRARIFSGMNLWERIPLSVVVSLVESIVDDGVSGTLLLKYIVEMYFNFILGGFRGGSAPQRRGVIPCKNRPKVRIDRG